MYIIYHKETTRLVHGIPGKHQDFMHKRFKTIGTAKAFLTRMVHAGANRADYNITDTETFVNDIEKHVTKKNLMSGKEFTQSINTPLCCDPSSETYWSM